MGLSGSIQARLACVFNFSTFLQHPHAESLFQQKEGCQLFVACPIPCSRVWNQFRGFFGRAFWVVELLGPKWRWTSWWNKQGPENESDKSPSLSLIQEAYSNNNGSRLQLSLSGKAKICNIEDDDQVSLNLGTSGYSLSSRVVKVGNVAGSPGKSFFSTCNPEKKPSLLRFPSLPKENIQCRSENLPMARLKLSLW